MQYLDYKQVHACTYTFWNEERDQGKGGGGKERVMGKRIGVKYNNIPE